MADRALIVLYVVCGIAGLLLLLLLMSALHEWVQARNMKRAGAYAMLVGLLFSVGSFVAGAFELIGFGVILLIVGFFFWL